MQQNIQVLFKLLSTSPSADTFLKTDGSGNLSFASAGGGGGLFKSFQYLNTTRYSISNVADNALMTFTFNKLQDGLTSKIIATGIIPFKGAAAYFCGIYFDCLTAGVTTHNTNDTFAFQGIAQSYPPDGSASGVLSINKTFESSDLAVGNHDFEFGWRVRSGIADRPAIVINPNDSDDSRNHQQGTVIILWEVLI